MYKKILVPLDGSDFSECSLKHVEAIASGCRVPMVVVMRVVEPFIPTPLFSDNPPPPQRRKMVDAILKGREDARQYLIGVANRLKEAGLATEIEVGAGDPAGEILSYAESSQADLIIMSTHGRSGVTRWFMGSVADRVVHHAQVPVLVVAPHGCRRA